MIYIKLITYSASFLLVFSCASNERPEFRYRIDNEQKANQKEFYAKRFRDATFYKCLHYGYGEEANVKLIKIMSEKDLFTPAEEPFFTEDFIQDSLVKQILSNLPPVYNAKESKIKDKNFIISTCLSFYESKELNKIAQKYYKINLKEDKKLED